MRIFDFVRETRGNVATATAVLALPLMAAAGTAVDVANLGRVKSDVQSALDASTMAIAIRVPSGLTDEELRQVGERHFEAHLDERTLREGATASFRYLGLETDEGGMQHVSAELDFPYRFLLADVFAKANAENLAVRDLHLKARISVRTGDTACVYALSRTQPRAVEAAGSTSIVMDGCVIASNSSATDAIYVGGSASLAADCLQSSGGIVATAALSLDCAASRENAWPLPDPFAGLVEPMPPILLSPPKKSDTVVQPGRYWNLDLDGTKKLEPGLYYIEKELTIKGEVSGDGVFFYLKDGGVTVNGNASLSLSAPLSGDYAGMLFMSHPTNTSAHLFNGNGDTNLDGYLYFPKGDLTYTGNNATTSNCLRIVANTIKISGSSVMRSDCTEELGGREARVSGPLHFTR